MSKHGIGRQKENVHYEQTGISDPYISHKGLKEPTICSVCNAIYHKKHWHWDGKLAKKLQGDKSVNFIKCPACRKTEDKYAMGKVLLSGSFINEHMDELISIIKSEERNAKEINPLDRLISIEKRDGGLYAETTSDALAMRIGHHLKKSFKGGDEDFKFRSGDKYVEVRWHKDQEAERRQ